MAEPPLLLIADASHGRAVLRALEAVFAAVPPGRVRVIERWKDRDGPVGARRSRLLEIARIVLSAGGLLSVSGRPDLAASLGATVHLPERGLPTAAVRGAFPGLRIGRSCHDRAGLLASGADYALLSPIAAPHSKPLAGQALGVSGFRALVADLDLPVYALGGITPPLAAALREAGAAGVATLGGVLGAPDPGQAARALLEAWDEPDAAAPGREGGPTSS